MQPFMALKIGQCSCFCQCGASSDSQWTRFEKWWDLHELGLCRRHEALRAVESPFGAAPDPVTAQEGRPSVPLRLGGDASSPVPPKQGVPEGSPEPMMLPRVGLQTQHGRHGHSYSRDRQLVEDTDTHRSLGADPAAAAGALDLVPRRQVASCTSLAWVGTILGMFWPKIDVVFQKVAKETFELKLRRTLPTALQSLQLEMFSLGQDLPHFTKIDIFESPCQKSELGSRGLEIHLGISMNATPDIKMQIGLLSAGITALSLKGTLVIRLDPLLDHKPIVGGVICYFLDPPTIDFTFSGIAQIADSGVLASTVRTTAGSLMANRLVLPNAVGVSLVENEDKVDTASLTDPKAHGVLRVTALRAEGLYGHDFNLFGEATSDPYLRLMLSADEWQSPVVYKNCNPVWTGENVHDFLVYDMVQRLRMDVHDWGPSWALDSGDVIGRAKPLRVMDLLELSGAAIPLFSPTADFEKAEPGPKSGSLYLDFKWLQITPERLQDDGCILKVKIDEVYIHQSKLIDAASVRVKVDGVEKSTPLVKHKPKKKHFAQINSPISSREASQSTFPNTIELEVEYIMSVALDAARLCATLVSKVVELSVVDRWHNVLSSKSVPLRELVRAPHHTLRWDRTGPMELPSAEGGSPILAEVKLSLDGITCGNQEEARRGMATLRKQLDARGLGGPSPLSASCSSAASLAELQRRCGPPEITTPRTSLLCVEPAESLQWANELLARLWPKVGILLQRKVEDPYGPINRQLQEKVPKVLQSMRFVKFQLGSHPPEFGPIKVCQAPVRCGQERTRGVELRVGMNLNSDADILLTVLGMTFGIQKLRISGELVIRLEPLLEEKPICGGIVVCFLDPPTIDMEFVKLARIVDNSLLAGTVRSHIDHAVARCLVMPHVWGKSLGSEEQGVDRALLRTPKLLGVLRVTAQRARGLPAQSATLLGASVSNPYLKLRLGNDEWSSSVAARTCNPEWDEQEHHDFFFFDWKQKLGVQVLEGRGRRANHCIAWVEPLEVATLLSSCLGEGGLPLSPPEREVHTPCGSLHLKCDWLLPKPGSRGADEKCIVRVKIDEVYLPLRLCEGGAMLRARLGGVEQATPVVRHRHAPRRPETSAGSLEDLDPEQAVELEIEFILHLLVKVADLEAGVLELELASKRRRRLGKRDVPMRDVLTAPGRSQVWGDESQPMLDMIGQEDERIEAMVCVSIRGLVQAPRELLLRPLSYSPPE